MGASSTVEDGTVRGVAPEKARAARSIAHLRRAAATADVLGKTGRRKGAGVACRERRRTSSFVCLRVLRGSSAAFPGCALPQYNTPMTDLSLARERHVAVLERTLHTMVAQLSAMPTVHRVILFGSYAAGRRDLFTDLDLLVVMETSLDFVSRTVDLMQHLHIEAPVDLLVYTPEEIERMRDQSFLRHALATGKTLYEKRPEH